MENMRSSEGDDLSETDQKPKINQEKTIPTTKRTSKEWLFWNTIHKILTKIKLYSRYRMYFKSLNKRSTGRDNLYDNIKNESSSSSDSTSDASESELLSDDDG